MHKGQRGFTLIEVLIVIGLTGIIAGGLTTAVMQVLTMSHRTTNRMTAVRQVQQAGFWVSPDVQMTQNVTLGASSGFPLTLIWKEEGGIGASHNVTYELIDMSGGLKKLQRSHSIEGGTPTVTSIAEYIDPSGTSCNYIDPVLTFTMTATLGGQSETKVYEVRRRPGST